MFNISDTGIIYVTRGDNFEVPLFINQGTELNPIRYIINEHSEIYFGIMEPNVPFEEGIVRKKYTYKDLNSNGDVLIKISHEDTCCLEPGKYYYQVKARLFNKETCKYEVNTIINRTQLFIEE